MKSNDALKLLEGTKSDKSVLPDSLLNGLPTSISSSSSSLFSSSGHDGSGFYSGLRLGVSPVAPSLNNVSSVFSDPTSTHSQSHPEPNLQQGTGKYSQYP